LRLQVVLETALELKGILKEDLEPVSLSACTVSLKSRIKVAGGFRQNEKP
jgi:hypothetical protein